MLTPGNGIGCALSPPAPSYRIAVFVAVAIMGGWLLSTVLKLGVARPRSRACAASCRGQRFQLSERSRHALGSHLLDPCALLSRLSSAGH